ncbi:MAG: hypothetical protein K6F07_02125 [Bacilli bacterium]|nr:hypothetical protein [Bacilli bacterium]
MKINVIRLRSSLSYDNQDVIKLGNQFIDEINNELFDDDILLTENDPKADFSIVFVETGGSEPRFVELKDLKEPIILISHGQNNSLPASLEIKTYCYQNNYNCILFAGEEREIASAIKEVSGIVSAYHQLDNTNLGVVGAPSDWLIASKVDYPLVKEKFNFNLIDISMEEFFDEIDKHEMVKIRNLERFKKRFKNEEVLNGALYIYSALKRLVDKYHLSALTVRCFDLLDRYKNTSCLALGMLNEEGITATCEGDIPSLLTMHILHGLTGLPSFQANPSTVDFKNNTILLAHCTLPINMCNNFSLPTHFESGLGIGIKGEMPLGKISIFKLAPNLKAEESVGFTANIKQNLSLPNYCRTQILIEPDENGILSLFKDNFGNHLIVTYADCLPSFYTLLNLYEKKYERNHKK